MTQDGSRRLTHAVTVTAPSVSYAFDPAPPARIDEGDTGHFRVNVTRDGRRSRVTEGVTSSVPDVLRLDLEGDRWRYTGIAPGTAEIRVTQDGSRRLTHAVTVSGRPEPEPPESNHPPVQRYRNCDAMRAAGWVRGVNRNGGTYRPSWNDAEIRTYNLNTTRDRDKDGHACEVT